VRGGARSDRRSMHFKRPLRATRSSWQQPQPFACWQQQRMTILMGAMLPSVPVIIGSRSDIKSVVGRDEVAEDVSPLLLLLLLLLPLLPGRWRALPRHEEVQLPLQQAAVRIRPVSREQQQQLRYAASSACVTPEGSGGSWCLRRAVTREDTNRRH
jgi:hypothetical protein